MLGTELQHGLRMFNAANFFGAHEALEDVWREAPRHSRLRRHLQGLVQVAVALHHQSTGNCAGARSVLERALRNLQGAEESLPNLDLERLRTDLGAWREFLAQTPMLDGAQPPRLPQLTLRGEAPQ